MKRRVLQVLFAVGLLLTLTVGTLWARGFQMSEQFVAGRPYSGPGGAHRIAYLLTGRHVFTCLWGYISISRVPRDPETDRPWQFDHTVQAPEPSIFISAGPGPLRERLGFQWETKQSGYVPVKYYKVSVPSWLVFATCLAITVWPFTSLRRMKIRRVRRAKGLCVTCAYDLRGAAHERCPECGEPVTVPTPV